MDLSILRTIRKSKKLSQEHVANVAGITQEYLSYIERNMKSPKTDDLEKICNELGLELCIIVKT